MLDKKQIWVIFLIQVQNGSEGGRDNLQHQ